MKHIRLYLFVLFIACSMFMVCPFALAEEMPSSVQQVLYDNISNLPNYNNFKSYVDSYVTQYKNFALLNVQNPSYPGTLIYFSNQDDLLVVFTNTYGDKRLPFTNTSYSYGLNSTNVSTWDNDSGIIGIFTRPNYYLIRKSETLPITINRFAQVRNSSFYVPYWNDYKNFQKIAGSSDNTFTTSDSISSSNYFSSFNSFCCQQDSVFSLFEQNVFPISYTEDERLKLYKLWSSQNGDSLVVDLSAFRSYTPAAAYEFSNIVITLTTNGVDTEYNLPLSSSTINNGWDNNSNLYTISTPVSDFTLSDTYDTFITRVSFSLDVSSPGGSGSTPYYISVNYSLDVHHSSITPGAVPSPATIYDDPAKPIDISDRKYDFFQQLQSSVMGGDIVYVNNYPVLPSWANVYNLNTFFYDNNPDDLHIYLGTQITGAFRAEKYDFDLKAFLYDNATSNFYDVVIIRIDNTDWPMIVNNNTIPDSQELYGYVVLYTDSYYNRLDAETQFNILEALQLDANQQVANWSWLVAKLDDFESKSLQILNPLYDESTFIDDKLASILYAVNNIESYNDSSIVTLLTDIKNLLASPENEIDTPQECIQLYEAHPDYFNELWGTPTPSLRSSSVTPSSNNPYLSSDYVRADLVPAWWEGKTLTMIYILKNDGDTSRFYNDILNGLFDSFENLIESDNSFNTFIDSLFRTGYDYTDSFYGHMFDLNYNPEAWDGGFAINE